VEKVKLQRKDVALGKPMPWNIYRSNGSILLKKGLRISSEKNLDLLMESDLLRDADSDTDPPSPLATDNTDHAVQHESKQQPLSTPSNPFEWINYFALQLGKIYKNIEAENSDALAQIQKLSTNIQKLSSTYHNQFLCAVHMYYPQPYSLMQPIYSALLCDMAAEILNYNATQRASLRAAALTANIGMYHYQDTLNKQNTPLTESQRNELQQHPVQSVQMLKAINIEDNIWLNSIAGHHERNDGSGYPHQITSPGIQPEAKIISLADSYLAMISNRSYSNTTPPKVALQKIYSSATDEDQVFYLSFIKSLGIFPPGTYVKLANNEIAIVTRQSKTSALQCIVSSICMEKGNLFNLPIERDTADKEFAIREFYAPSATMNINPFTLWGYKPKLIS
jgi:HD-GYP domain-containing protein (c-di-GMP phosphodiesterase class II)